MISALDKLIKWRPDLQYAAFNELVDTASAELAQLRADLTQAQARIAELTAERDAARAERDAARAERDAAKQYQRMAARR